MSRTLLVTMASGKDKRISIPEDGRVTFGPWSPPGGTESKYAVSEKALAGTLRVYSHGTKATENVLLVLTGVTGFFDATDIVVEEKLAEVVGSTAWSSSRDGYKIEEQVRRKESWAPAGELASGEEGEDL